MPLGKISSTHVAFSDDSAGPKDRYKSLALVTLPAKLWSAYRKRLNKILEDANIFSEFKWSKLRNERYRRAAWKLINFAFNPGGQLRIDVLIWDLRDSRHEVFGRDDNENLVRMYYHLLSNTLGEKWPTKEINWNWFPDQQSPVDWDLLQDYLESKRELIGKDFFHEHERFKKVDIKNITPSDSEEHPMIQIADLFAGLGAFSWSKFITYNQWKLQHESMNSLFDKDYELNFSNSEKRRFWIIQRLNHKCKNSKMHISLHTKGGFYSYNPDSFLNFWLYQPQGNYDSAPTRK